MNTEPDGFIGAVIAAQSVKGLKAMINGPGGCRSRALNLLREMLHEYHGDDACCCRTSYMSRVSLLPCTHLNADDIILGSGTKIEDGLRSVISDTGAEVVLIDTLGATVQVVDRDEAVRKSGYPEKVILADEDLSDLSYTEGFDRTFVHILDHYLKDVKKDRIPFSVNILGYSIADIGWDYGKKELSAMMEKLGIVIDAFVGCDTPVEDLENSSAACLNILIHPEMCIQTAEWYKENYRIPYLIPSDGTPIGFDSIRSFIREVAVFFRKDPEPALEMVETEDRRAKRILRNYDKFAGSLRGSASALHGLGSDILPMARILYEEFNLVPRSVVLRGTNTAFLDNRVHSFLAGIGCADVVGAPLKTSNLRVFMSDGYSADRVASEEDYISCIGIMMPFVENAPLANRCLIGISGTLNLLDSTINGLMKFSCGQPTPADFR